MGRNNPKGKREEAVLSTKEGIVKESYKGIYVEEKRRVKKCMY